jgi:serine/threonine-protein kinase HipA
MLDIFELLKASDDPDRDQLIFLQAQILFWLLAAIDGHAKNFSIFLRPGGGVELAPLYDVMSAQPLYVEQQIQRKDMKLAMAVGNNSHYHIHEIQPRHYLQTADRAGLPDVMAAWALEEVADTVPDAIRIACETLPADFPADIRDSIVEGALNRREIITATAQA